MLASSMLATLALCGSSVEDWKADRFATSLALIGREVANDTLVVGDGTHEVHVGSADRVAAAHFFDAATGAYRFSAAAGFTASSSEDGLCAAGDLDGDGFEDVWVSVHDEEYRAHFLALSGSDGRVLVDAVPPGADQLVAHGVLFHLDSDNEESTGRFEVLLTRLQPERKRSRILGGRLSASPDRGWSIVLDDWVLLEGGATERAKALAYRREGPGTWKELWELRHEDHHRVLQLDGRVDSIELIPGAELLAVTTVRYDEWDAPIYRHSVHSIDLTREVAGFEWPVAFTSGFSRLVPLSDSTGDGVGELAITVIFDDGGELAIVDPMAGEVLHTLRPGERPMAELDSWNRPHFGYDVLEAPRAASEPRALWVASCAGWRRGAPGCVQLLEPATGREVLFFARPIEVLFAEPAAPEDAAAPR